jgi:diguanylate cyclase (GGDEF)-like protein
MGLLSLFHYRRFTPPDWMRDTLAGLGRTIGLAMANLRNVQRLRVQATHDALTGLPNRTLLHDRMERAIAAAQTECHRAALLLIDLDGFKEINDTLGHNIGDGLLRLLAQRLDAVVGDGERTLARLGGDEFAIVLPCVADADVAATYARRVRSALRRPFTLEGVTLEVGASVGIALCPDHGTDGSSLLRCADVAMYRAKRDASGHGVYSPGLDPHTPRRLSLIAELGAAIRDDQLVLHYQPKVDAEAQRVVGFEALIRWNHPEWGLLPPAEFIELVEMSELIRPMTRWVVDRALRQWRAWRDQGRQLTVAVNISARSLLDRDFPNEIASALETYQVDPGQLELEITESALINDPERAQQTLERLNGLGVRFAIDDFGTGYSSLSYLRRLPIQTLKIDRSFIAQVTEQQHDQIIVQSTITLAKNLALKVVAEGVEDHSTLDYLGALGCDMVQGYFVSRPLEVNAADEWLAGTA